MVEDSKQSEAPSLKQFKQIMDKLSLLDTQMQEHFGNLTSKISILRDEMKQELDGVKKSLRDVEVSRGCLGFNQRHPRRNKNPQ